MKQFDKVLARFNPKITSDLSPRAFSLIGKDFIYEAGWVIDADDCEKYKGQWAMFPIEDGFPWVPLCDLEIIEYLGDK